MLTIVHLLVGAAIGKNVESIFLIIVIALISHWIMDSIPHYSPRAPAGLRENGFSGVDMKELILKSIEPILGIALVAFLIYRNKELALPMVIGAFFAWVPDLMTAIIWKYQLTDIKMFFPVYGSVFYRYSASIYWGILQVGIALVAILTLILKVKA